MAEPRRRVIRDDPGNRALPEIIDVTAGDGFEVREGDVLVVNYPEMKISPAGTYSSVTIGGLMYSRKLCSGDNINAEYDRVYGFLRGVAERDGRAKMQEFIAELAAAKAASRSGQ